MGLGSWLGIGKEAGEAMAKPVEAIGNTLDALFTSDDERLTRQEALERLRGLPALGQIELAKIEAAHRTLFVAGWRPAIGWVCAAALATYYLPQFLTASGVWVYLCLKVIYGSTDLTGIVLPAYPIGAISGLMELVLGMLGLGTLRTFEKLGGKAK
ncbi:3TM-type holin [Desulfocurvibacter africanus]|uniref:3TM-type holin n=1 Tax=Desulfocurvibacter africanus TaxID=873 RepID=UPI00040145E1|nr:3TM-type holin [Desulfocurvibacter africanus]